MQLRKGQWPILSVNVGAVLGFGLYYLLAGNSEFIIYIGVIVFFLLLMLSTNHRMNYPNGALWGLTVWALLHMAGGSIHVGGERLYELMIFRIPGELPVLRYDQFVHIVGFGAATYVMYCLLRTVLGPVNFLSPAVSIVVVMAGLGVGALNEVIEFLITLAVPGSGVGGYVNTSLDLVADLVGALLALIAIQFELRARVRRPAAL